MLGCPKITTILAAQLMIPATTHTLPAIASAGGSVSLQAAWQGPFGVFLPPMHVTEAAPRAVFVP